MQQDIPSQATMTHVALVTLRAPHPSVMTHLPSVQPRSPEQDIRLHEAARAGNRSRVRSLLEAGAAIDAPDANGNTPLLFAAMAGHLSVVRHLVAAGANREHTNALGYDAYTAAMFSGDFKGVTRSPFDDIMTLVEPSD